MTANNDGIAMAGSVAEGFPDARTVAGLQSSDEQRDLVMLPDDVAQTAIELDVRGKSHITVYVDVPGLNAANVELVWEIGHWGGYSETVVAGAGVSTFIDRERPAHKLTVNVDGTEGDTVHVAASATI